MKDDYIVSERPWNTAQQYTITLGQAATDANRYLQEMAFVKNQRAQGLLFMSSFKMIRFMAFEMKMSERFKDDLNTLNKIIEELNKLPKQYTNQTHTNLDNIWLRLADLYAKRKVVEYVAPQTTPEDSALRMMR